MPTLRHARGTRAALDALATANGLLAGQIYALTDENRIALALTVSTYETFAKESEAAAEEVTATKPSPVDADQLIMLDSAAAGAPVLVTKAQLLAGLGDAPVIPDLPPLGLWDYWYFMRLAVTSAAAPDMFIGAPISSGTNTTGLPSTGQAGYNNHGVLLRSSATPNAGYKYATSSLVAHYFGAISQKFRGQFMPVTSHTGRTIRMGFLDTATSADSTDGAYFEIVDGTCSAKTANNSTRTTNATTVALTLAVPYTFDIDVNAAGTEVRFRVYEANNNVPVLDVTNTTNIPTTVARSFGVGLVATESSSTASDIGVLYGLGMGTVEAFQTRDIAGVLGDIQTILESI